MPPHRPLRGPSSSRCSVKLHCKTVERKQERLCLKPVFLIQGPHWGNLTPDQQSCVKPLSEQGLYRWTLASIWCVQRQVALVREWSALCSRSAHESTRLNAMRIAAFIYLVVLFKISDFCWTIKLFGGQWSARFLYLIKTFTDGKFGTGLHYMLTKLKHWKALQL